MATDLVLVQICREFAEMPGMCLTVPQAARLFGLDETTSAEALGCLAAIGFLAVADQAALARPTSRAAHYRRNVS